MDELFTHLTDTVSEKDILTEEIMVNIIEHCKSDFLLEINMSEIINSLLLVYVQNTDMCYNGGMQNNSRKIQSGGNLAILLLIFLIIIFLWYILQDKKSTVSTEKMPTRVATEADYAQLRMKVERDRKKRAEQYAAQQAAANQ
jgi:hypothetical protein